MRKPNGVKGASALARRFRMSEAHRTFVVSAAVAVACGIAVRRRVVVSRLRKEKRYHRTRGYAVCCG